MLSRSVLMATAYSCGGETISFAGSHAIERTQGIAERGGDVLSICSNPKSTYHYILFIPTIPIMHDTDERDKNSGFDEP